MHMKALPLMAATLVALTALPAGAQNTATISTRTAAAPTDARVDRAGETSAELVALIAESRFEADLAAMQEFRPGYAFWQHVFRIPDGSVAFGSATDGRLLAVFPARGDWSRAGTWDDPRLASVVRSTKLPTRIGDRRDVVASLLEPAAGPIVHNMTRGRFVEPNERRYGRFLEEWGRIYERFGVPAELGLAQGLIESGLNGTVRSEARAIGFCQWLMSNWNVLKRLSPHVIEGYNQTTQVPYCAAYLTVLATKYGSFIPALSEHHAGGTNVGRTIHNGLWLGGEDVRQRYFLGAAFSRDIRTISPRTYEDVYGTYGPRSYFYSEMVFGNMMNVRRIKEEQKQVTIHAMRASRNIPLSEIQSRTRLSVNEIRRYNPALVRQVPRNATLYLPRQIDAFGTDVAFWHRPAPQAFTDVLSDFLSLEHDLEDWDNGRIVPELERFAERFRRTRSEEGTIMATVLAYVVQEIKTSGRGAILAEFRSSPRVRALFDRAVNEIKAAKASTDPAR
jgi:hypothetical protein